MDFDGIGCVRANGVLKVKYNGSIERLGVLIWKMTCWDAHQTRTILQKFRINLLLTMQAVRTFLSLP